jgi:hypothetical protein
MEWNETAGSDVRHSLGVSLLAGPRKATAERPTAAQDPLWLASRPLAHPLGRAEACRRDHVFDVDG